MRSADHSSKHSAEARSQRRSNFTLIACGVALGYLGRLVLGIPPDNAPARTFQNPEVVEPAEDVLDLPLLPSNATS